MKRSYSKHSYHLARLGLASVLAMAFLAVQLDANHTFASHKTDSSVLAYATDMSQGGLLTGTNAARGANGLTPLRNNPQLNNSAQLKAQHLADNNYWAHVAPDGTQPWYFFQVAGYSYSRAGENLAYGFASSQATVDGWMASPTHRANILGEYVDVGFGIVNAPNYQGKGNETIVVAHYGTPLTSSPAPAPAPTPTPAPAPSPTPAPIPAPAPAAPKLAAPSAPTPTPAPQPAPQESSHADSSPGTQAAPAPDKTLPATSKEVSQQPVAQAAIPVQTGGSASVSLANLLAQKRAPLVALGAMTVVAVTTAGYTLTHRRAVQEAFLRGEQFIAAHPVADMVILLTISALILLTTYARIN